MIKATLGSRLSRIGRFFSESLDINVENASDEK